MEVTFLLKTDIQIPNHLYDEAAELFLNHLKKYYEEQLLRDDSCRDPSEILAQTKNRKIRFLHYLNHQGKSCPLYYKKPKAIRNDLQDSQVVL